MKGSYDNKKSILTIKKTKAASKIQQVFRQRLCTNGFSTNQFILYENAQARYSFNINELAEYFLSSANFVNFYTRRLLNDVEVFRFISKLKGLRKYLVETTYKCRHLLKNHIKQVQSIQDFEEAEAGRLFDQYVDRLEKEFDDDYKWDEYECQLEHVNECKRIIKHHLCCLDRRKLFIQDELYKICKDRLDSLLRVFSDKSPCHRYVIVDWLKG